jgi:REP element-mobilizing transposase RayT
MGRGIEKRKIFWNDEDRDDLISRLAELGEKQALKIYAWALLPNHFHLLCKTQNWPLSSSMRKLLTGYAVNFNRRHKRYGHLFQNRYKSIVCQEDNSLLELVRYIHLNLLRAGIVKNLLELNRSPWTGHSALVGKKKKAWQDTEYILSFFGNGPKGIKKYLEFIQEGIPLGRRPELVGGGLRGWSAVLALRGRIERQIADARIFGGITLGKSKSCRGKGPSRDVASGGEVLGIFRGGYRPVSRGNEFLRHSGCFSRGKTVITEGTLWMKKGIQSKHSLHECPPNSIHHHNVGIFFH